MLAVRSHTPQKTRELQNHHMDSRLWNDFTYRDDDVVVATYGKSGTTWMQQIVGQLIFAGREDVAIHELSPWLEMRALPPQARAALDAQTHRRVIKTHLPLDALVFSTQAKYLYVARDGRDVLWSLYNHHARANDLFYQVINTAPGRRGPPLDRPPADVRGYFRTWLEKDGAPFWSFWDNLASWWMARHLPNVMLVHFNALKTDLEGEMRRIAAFLEIDTPDALWPTLIEHCGFDYMKANAERMAPLGGAIFTGGAKSFINKGANGRWRDVLSREDSAAYEARAVAELGCDCARWLATGELERPAWRGAPALAN
jgi:aryl sulfotransferase